MDPIFVQIGPLAIRWYGLLIAGGVLAGTLVTLDYARRRGLSQEKVLDMGVWLVVAGIIGARLVYVLTSPSAFFGPGGNPADAFKVWEGGISIHGGVLGVVFASWLFSRKHKLNMWAYLDVLSPIAGFGIIGGRLGNIMNGTDTGGRLTNWPVGFTWPEPGTETLGAFGRFVFGPDLWSYFPGVCSDGSYIPLWQCQGAIVRGPVHFTQMYGVVIGVAVLLITLWALNRSTKPGYVFWQMVLWYSILRAVLEETFRDNPLLFEAVLEDGLDRAGIGLFTATQVASVVLVALAIWMLARVNRGPDLQVPVTVPAPTRGTTGASAKAPLATHTGGVGGKGDSGSGGKGGKGKSGPGGKRK